MVHNDSIFKYTLAIATCILSLFVAKPASSEERLIKSATITMMIGAGPGSGYDTYGRLVARHLGRFLPGNPSIVPTNMVGADGLRGANWLYQNAARDGSVIGILENSTPLESLLEPAHANMDPRTFHWLGSLNSIANIAMVWHTSPIKTVDELIGREVIIGATSGNSDSVVMPKLLNAMIGTKFKIVTGYGSSNEIVLAMDRGEVEGALGISSDSLTGPFGGLLREKKFRILMQIDLAPASDPFLQGVPSFLDYVKNSADMDVVKLLISKLQFGRPFAAPPGLPRGVADQLRNAFANMAADPEFLAEAEKLNVPVRFSAGSEIERNIQNAYEASPSVIEKALGLIKAPSNR